MYVQRDPYNTDLHSIIRENYRQVFHDKEVQGVQMPFHLEREFKKYTTCGILAYGMARFRCPCCYEEKIVAYSCKSRTICPSCTGRRTADTAKHLLEEVIPEVPVRQWVLSMPYAFRFLLATRPEFLRAALAIYHRAINNFYLKKAKALKLQKSKVGAITAIQRFGSNLALNVHFHTIYTDGVFHENYLGEEVFYEIIPTHDEVVEVTGVLKKRLNRLIAKEEENIASEDEALLHMQAMSVQNQDEDFKKPKQLGKIYDSTFNVYKSNRCCYDDGFSLHANVKIPGHLRSGLEGLLRYVLRGPLAQDRISYDDAGQVLLKLKTPYSDGTTQLKFTPEQFIKRIIALIPPARQNLIRYIGVFGARHTKRAVITAMAKPGKEVKVKIKKKNYRTPWGELLKHVFKIDVTTCACGGKLELIACITSREICRKILNHLGLPIYEIKAAAPRGPPERDFFDQCPEYC